MTHLDTSKITTVRKEKGTAQGKEKGLLNIDEIGSDLLESHRCEVVPASWTDVIFSGSL